MGFTQSISICLRKYFNFLGRASRSEFWWFYLFYVVLCYLSGVIIGIVAALINSSGEGFASVTFIILAIPLWAAASRRLHDIGKSGWWNLLALTGIGVILLIVWYVTGTEQKDNKYGPLEQS